MNNKPKNSRQLQAENTKNRILESIVILLNTKDMDKITINEICKKSKIAVGTFYTHFESKEAALLFCYRDADSIFEQLFLEDLNPINQIYKILETHIHMPMKDIKTTRQVYICHLKHFDPYFSSEERPFFSILNNSIKQAQVEGYLISSISTHALTWKLLHFSRGLILNYCISDPKILPLNWEIGALSEIKEYLQLFLIK